MTDCLFCKIIAGEIPCDKVYEDEEIFAFRDIDPQAPTHILVLPKRHIPSLASLETDDSAIMGRLAIVSSHIATDLGLSEGGYRWVVNCGSDACQTVPHIHLHLLGGRALGWPPG